MNNTPTFNTNPKRNSKPVIKWGSYKTFTINMYTINKDVLFFYKINYYG